MTSRAGRIEGPAKWAAVIVLGGAGLIGIGRSFLVETVHAPPSRAQPARVQAEPLPRTEQQASPEEAVHEDQQVSASDSIAVRIAVNTASASELDLLPGIGPVYAERIVAEREANGPFTSIDDLQRVRGIGPKTAAKLEPLVSFERP